MEFSKTNLNQNIQKAINELGFKDLTPIQEAAIPYLLKNKSDLVALAQTGTGKTAAFGLPLLQKIEIKRETPQTIILCPTRELCLQITKDMLSYAKYTKEIKITSVYGGASINPQIKSLKSGTQIVVGTPGRVIDLIKRRALKLQNIESVVLDEADEMLNMGFKDDLDIILAETPNEKQTLLFSATMPKEVMRISKNYMSNAKTIEVASRNEGAKNVEHHYYLVNASDRYNVLRRICDINPDIYGIVFCRTRKETANTANKLTQDGYNADAIHGELSQAQRDYVMKRFRTKEIEILVATDVAARGIDINELTHVINYNLPDDNEVYVHRSGRTGRAGSNGISIIIAHRRDGKKLKSIERMIKRDLILKKVPSGEEICQIQIMKMINKVVSSKVNSQIEKYLPSIKDELAHLDKDQLIKHFVSNEFNRFLSFYKNSPDLNVSIKNKSGHKNKKGKREHTGHAEPGYTRFFINLGKEQNLQAHNLIGLINEYTQNKNIPIGKIDIMRRFSFFEVLNKFEKVILDNLSNASWNGNYVNVEISQIPGNKSERKSKNERERKKRKSYLTKKDKKSKKNQTRKQNNKLKEPKSSKQKNKFKKVKKDTFFMDRLNNTKK